MEELTLSQAIKKWGTPIVIGILVVILWPFGMVGAGERGVVLNWGAATGGVKSPGLYLRVPIMQEIVHTNVQIQKEQVEAAAASKDLQTVHSQVALNFHISPDAVVALYRDVGTEYKERLIDPALQEVVKAATAKYNAEELIGKRELVREEIRTLLAEKMQKHGIVIDEFNIVNFDFSKSFNDAIEAKVTAEQNALAAKNKLEQVKYEAEQRITQAKGEAEAIKIQAAAIQSQGGSDYVKLQWIRQWNGVLPTTMLGESTALINIK